MHPQKPEPLSGDLVWLRLRPLFKDERHVWLRRVESIPGGFIFHMGRHDAPGLTWTIRIDEIYVQRAVIGDHARQAYVLALAKAATKSRPVHGEMQLVGA